jgi:hypothetical protein
MRSQISWAESLQNGYPHGVVPPILVCASIIAKRAGFAFGHLHKGNMGGLIGQTASDDAGCR